MSLLPPVTRRVAVYSSEIILAFCERSALFAVFGRIKLVRQNTDTHTTLFHDSSDLSSSQDVDLSLVFH